MRDAAESEVIREAIIVQPPSDPGKTLMLTLPWPPSVGHYLGRRIVKKRDGKTFVQEYHTQRAKLFREHVGKLGMDFQAKEWARAHVGRMLSVRVDCYPPDRRARDLGNLDKVLMDSLAHAGLIRDDFDVWDQRFTRMCQSAPPGRVVVRIKAFDPNARIAA